MKNKLLTISIFIITNLIAGIVLCSLAARSLGLIVRPLREFEAEKMISEQRNELILLSLIVLSVLFILDYIILVKIGKSPKWLLLSVTFCFAIINFEIFAFKVSKRSFLTFKVLSNVMPLGQVNDFVLYNQQKKVDLDSLQLKHFREDLSKATFKKGVWKFGRNKRIILCYNNKNDTLSTNGHIISTKLGLYEADLMHYFE